MKSSAIHIPFAIYTYDELPPSDLRLIDKAIEATRGSYAPYSHFSVGAAVQLENGMVVSGSNQENAAFPSGMCAERVALFHAGAQWPDVPAVTLAIAARDAHGQFPTSPISPCGACRQVMAQVQHRGKHPLRILLHGQECIYEFRNVDGLLPLAFCGF